MSSGRRKRGSRSGQAAPSAGAALGDSGTRESADTSNPWWPVVVLVLAGGLVYWNSLSGPLIFDDQLTILDNARIREWWRIAQVLTPDPHTPVGGRPLVNLSLALNYAVGGLAVGGYHLANIAWHILCALVFFGLVRRTLSVPRLRDRHRGMASPLAFACALLWLVHPLNSEVVDYLTQRSESMMALFFLLTIYGCVRGAEPGASRRWSVVAVVSSALGMACKETMVTAPVVVLIFDRVFLFGSARRMFEARSRLYLALAATWLVLFGLQWSNPRGASAGFSTPVGVWTYVLNQPVMITAYLRRVFWPTDLVAFYGWPLPLTPDDIVPYALLVAALAAATVVALAVAPLFGFLGAWFFITLAPASSIVPIVLEVGAERRMYLPLMAIAVLVVVAGDRSVRWCAQALGADGGGRSRWLPTAVGAVVLGVVSASLAGATVSRNRDYASELTLARTMVQAWPTSVNHSILGGLLAAAGQKNEAEAQLRLAVGDVPRARYDLGALLFSEGRLDESIAQLTTFLQIALAPPAEHPPWQPPTAGDLVRARTLLGHGHAQRGEWASAIGHLQQVVAVEPSNAAAHRSLARSLRGVGRVEDAIAQYRECLAYTPNDGDALIGLGISLDTAGRGEEAIAAFQRAVATNPNLVEAQQDLAIALRRHRQVAR